MLTYTEVGKHNTKTDCWVIIHGKVYNVSTFLHEHPGGSSVILKYGGKDATKAFDPIHSSNTLDKYLPKEFHLGPVDTASKPTRPPTRQTYHNTGRALSAQLSTTLMVGEFDVEYDEHADLAPLQSGSNTCDSGSTPDKVGGLRSTEDTVNDRVEAEDEDEELAELEKRRLHLVKRKPDLGQIYNLHDFEFVAKKIMDPIAWAYYSSGADDEIALRNNHLSYQRIFFRPKILVDVSRIDLSTTMLGRITSAPFYITATALGKLGHPDGEKVLTRAAAKQNIIQMVPTLSSCSFDEIADAANHCQTQWFQLYVNSDRNITRSIVQHAELRGIRGLFITVDAPQLGRREKDMRLKKIEDLSHVQGDGEDADRSQGAARAISSFIDTSLNWDDLRWFRSITKMPIVLKGVQSVDDALKAIRYKVDGIVLSNHGGRQLDSVRAPIEILAELVPILKERHLADKIDIFIDGGVRRGSDILKAIALGAKGVGVGRPFLYAMSTYGDDGVSKAIQILKDELVMNMRLLGASSMSSLNETYIDMAALNSSIPNDRLFSEVYEPLTLPKFKPKM